MGNQPVAIGEGAVALCIFAKAADERTQALVGRVVGALSEPRLLVTLLREVARSEAGSRLSADDYRLLGTCFFEALDSVLGPRLDPRARDACMETVMLLAALMSRLPRQTSLHGLAHVSGGAFLHVARGAALRVRNRRHAATCETL